MGISLSVLMITAGAILVLAVDAEVAGVSLSTVGWIYLVVGAVGAVLSVATRSELIGTGQRQQSRRDERAGEREELP